MTRAFHHIVRLRPLMPEAGGRMQRRVFISVQRTLDTWQSEVLTAVLRTLHRNGLIGVGLDYEPTVDPFPLLRAQFGECVGTVVIAFARLHITEGQEFPGSAESMLSVSHRRMSTVWSHIEAAMAYQAGLPVFMLLEAGLFPCGFTDQALSSIATHAIERTQNLSVNANVLEALSDWLQTHVTAPTHMQ